MWVPGDEHPRSTAERSERLQQLRAVAAGCQACPLWEIDTRTVFGDGPGDPLLMFIGEAPGAQEDAAGKPFVGPAGQLFADAIAAAGLPREQAYITNVVKHRPWVKTGHRGRNRPPKQSEINACHPWLAQELSAIQPRVVCCMGAVAAKAILGRDFKLTQQRGEWQATDAIPHVLATVHPSFVMIQAEPARQRWQQLFDADIRAAVERARGLAAPG